MASIPPEFKVSIDSARCRKCGICVNNCSFGALEFRDGRVIPDDSKCVACYRCVSKCPDNAITISNYQWANRGNANWTPEVASNIQKQAEFGGILLSGMGNPRPHKIIWDHLLIDACQVTNPSIDPLREPMELRTYLGKKPDNLEFVENKEGEIELATELQPQVKLDVPVVFAAMSYGAVSLNTHKALALAARKSGTLMNTGEGGLHEDLYRYSDNIMVQVASGRFGVHNEYLNTCSMIEIKIGQGAKPGIGGHLPGEKVGEDISKTRMIPLGTDVLSPAPHHDIYSIEDLSQLIYALKEATNYEKPVGVKISAVHNVAAIASGVVRAGADVLTIDGYRGGSGASPMVIRDNVGIPIELALATVDQRLRDEGIRNRASILCAGSIRSSADVAKAVALGADAVVIGTAALIAMGCSVCQRCYTGNCAWGIATQKPELVNRLDPEIAAQKLTNLLSGWSFELKEILGSLGVNSIESLRGNRERLRGYELDEKTLELLGIKPAGVGQ
ncbi:Glutamate synthase (NADPH) [Methanohalobium evestigatum Z-7303]|uniref:Archaeal glutamate synthase [NADPH] n=1 Tax=Methanohalobium evestigatum (strain ATCC BAA-1072 / DSM 3721 / NBRC 107634 / OCM 161 / Z-7303) TaxID=644295 RepID=D7E9Q8_METEZ|nr:glutamate synthase-related protein [Methanohalobium evestigatum]ADI74330.1 Glutamate synthase (NADPH) [Methanohalobium evestigatum Z-7303]